MNLPTQIQTVFRQRQARAVFVGVLMLSIVAVLQVINTNGPKPLVALLESHQLCEGDLERMEFAIGKSGITGCKVENGMLMVPENRKEACLNAIAENDALPQFLRSESEPTPTVNPFLSRAQQKLIQTTQKKKLVREMVMRLPFVKNAWFEMDAKAGGSVFAPAEQTAVVSIEPPKGVELDVNQVATIREMISGSIAGLPAHSVRVIDVTLGYAHRPSNAENQKVVSIDKRSPFEQETFYRKRIQQAIKPFGEIDVQVQVDLIEDQNPTSSVAYTRSFQPAESKPVSPVAAIGTNRSVSINDFQPAPKLPEVVTPVVVEPSYSSRVGVVLQVPESVASQMAIGKPAFPNDKPNIKQQAINQLGRKLVDTVKPILPQQSFAKGTAFPISIQFIPPAAQPVAVTTTWQDQLKGMAAKHWPSIAVLLVGVVLLTVMTRNSEIDADEVDELMNEDIISINSTTENQSSEPVSQSLPEVAIAQPEDYSRRDAELKLGKMVEKDPDSAARVIESWIRNAG